MVGYVSVAGVGAVASSTQIQTAHQVAAVAKTKEVVENLGASTLKLIQASFVPVAPDTGNDLDVSV